MLRRAGGELEGNGLDGAGSGATDDFRSDSGGVELVSWTRSEGLAAPTAGSLSSGGLEGTLGSAEGTLDSASTVGKPGGVLARLDDTLGKPGGVGTLERRGGTLGKLGGVGTFERRGGALGRLGGTLGRLGGTLERLCSGMTEIRDGRGLSATVPGTASVFSSESESHPESMSSVEGGNDSIDDGAGVDVAAPRPCG